MVEVIRERVRARLENSRRNGRIGGRRPTIDSGKVVALRRRLIAGQDREGGRRHQVGGVQNPENSSSKKPIR